MENDTNFRIPSNAIARDLKKEALFGINDMKFYAYKDSSFSSLKVVGQVFVGRKDFKEFRLIINIYDLDGDILMSQGIVSFGDGVVSEMIEPEYYFDGFPFEFSCLFVKWDEVSKIEIVPTGSY